jgi:hypothetical protein
VESSSRTLDGASCPSTSLCVAVDNAGNVVTSTRPASGAASWHVVHVDDAAMFFDGVSCTLTSLCVGAGAYGNVVVGTSGNLPPKPKPAPAPTSVPNSRAAIRDLRVSPSRFYATSPGRSHTGARIRYTDTQAAATQFTVLARTSGMTSGRGCVALPWRRPTQARPCFRYLRVASFTHRDVAGTNDSSFTGHLVVLC